MQSQTATWKKLQAWDAIWVPAGSFYREHNHTAPSGMLAACALPSSANKDFVDKLNILTNVVSMAKDKADVKEETATLEKILNEFRPTP